MILTALACPVFTSCYNDAALWDEIEGIHGDVESLEQKLAALEAKLNTDLQALQTLLESQISKLEGKVDALVTVKDVKENTDGSVTVILSDNTEFTVHPKFEQDYKGLVTTTTIDGVLYWAVFDENGKATAVTDKDGNLVPVVDVVPQVRVNPETALVEISFDGGNTWTEVGYNEPCVFESAEIVWTDNWTDEQEATGYYDETPMYVVITLPDGNTISLTLDGVASFMFGGHMGGAVNGSYYIPQGAVSDVGILTTNITDWVKDVPAGWKVEELNVEYAADGGASFRITAPTADAIASGSAVAEGFLKVLAVAEGGKTVSTSLMLTTVPFSEFSAGKGGITVTMNGGCIGGYVVGVSTLSDYDPEAIVAELEPLITDIEESPWGSYPNWPYNNPGYDYFESPVSGLPIDDLMTKPEMVLGEQYVVWVLPVNSFIDSNWNMSYTAGSICSVVYNNVAINLEVTELAFNTIQISAEFEGIEMYYGSFSQLYSSELNKEGILAEFNSGLTASYGSPNLLFVNDEYIDGWNNSLYSGSPATLVQSGQSIEPGNRYYMYLIPAVEGKTKYSMSEVYWYEWTTPGLTSGGTLKVTAGEAENDYKTISVPLSAEGAVYIYYYFVDPEKISTIEDKAAYLIEDGKRVASDSYTVREANLTPGAKKVLIAMAVDQDGKYGEVFQKEYSTQEMTFASATVTATVQGEPSMTGIVKISCDAEVDTYYYWYGPTSDYYWTSQYYFGGSAETASSYIALNPLSYMLDKVSSADLPEDGIEITDLPVGSPCVFVVSAKLIDGTYTKATVVNFTPSLNLGTIVSAKDDNGNDNAAWVAAKPTVNYTLDSVGDDSSVTWTVSDLPEGWTGFTAVVDSEYTSSHASDKDLITFLVQNEYGFATKYELVNGESYSKHWLYTANYDLYVVIVDPDGNYYAPYKWNFDATAGGFGI